MTLSTEKKIPMLYDFHKYLYDMDWKFMFSQVYIFSMTIFYLILKNNFPIAITTINY